MFADLRACVYRRACFRVCIRACTRACVCVCVCVCVREREREGLYSALEALNKKGNYA